MRFLRWSRHSGQPLVAGALLLAFLSGWAGAALHLTAAASQPRATLVLSDPGNGAPVGHSDQDCRLCSSAHSTVLVQSPLVPCDAGTPLRAQGKGFNPLLPHQVSTGALGSRAPPAISL